MEAEIKQLRERYPTMPYEQILAKVFAARLNDQDINPVDVVFYMLQDVNFHSEAQAVIDAARRSLLEVQ